MEKKRPNKKGLIEEKRKYSVDKPAPKVPKFKVKPPPPRKKKKD